MPHLCDLGKPQLLAPRVKLGLILPAKAFAYEISGGKNKTDDWLTPPALVAAGPPARKPVMSLHELLKELEADRQERSTPR